MRFGGWVGEWVGGGVGWVGWVCRVGWLGGWVWAGAGEGVWVRGCVCGGGLGGQRRANILKWGYAAQAADEVEAQQREAILATKGAAKPDFLRTLNKETCAAFVFACECVVPAWRRWRQRVG